MDYPITGQPQIGTAVFQRAVELVEPEDRFDEALALGVSREREVRGVGRAESARSAPQLEWTHHTLQRLLCLRHRGKRNRRGIRLLRPTQLALVTTTLPREAHLIGYERHFARLLGIFAPGSRTA